MRLLLSGLRRGPVQSLGLHRVLMTVALFGTVFAHADAADANFNGHYELADIKPDRTFSLDVKQTGSKAEVKFSAAMADGSGAAPDGTGKGRVEDGVLSFILKDSFNNECACTLVSGADGYLLSMTVTKVVDPGPFHFYGNVLLKKTSSKAR
ncbi:MAG: hypothetical protein LV480_07320 [Methylacidiphilales bacterium]|nr:hypothetical protein [Candidatus Methylacidiphilales bacterium]